MRILTLPTYGFFVVWSALACTCRADERPVTAEQTAFFEQAVRPLLIERCYKCHAQEKQVKGGLRLDSRAGWQKGGDTGPSIVPGKPDDSLLVQAVRYRDADLQMPPEGKLSDAEIARLDEWVRMGAPDPRDGTTSETGTRDGRTELASHWAFQPLQTVNVPAVRHGDWPLNDVDPFIPRGARTKGTPAVA